MSADAAARELRALLDDPPGVWRAPRDGVGFVGPDVPIELLIASGRPFGHLPWRADGVTPWADRWLESGFPFWSRSILEQWHDGAFDALETVVFSRADDASQRLYYYVAELQRRGKLRGPTPRMFDIALIPRESSRAHTESALLGLMDVLGVAKERLPAGIDGANRLRRRFAELEQGRGADGPFFERLLRAALWTDPCPWIDRVPMPEQVPAAVRVLLAGSVPPDGRLHEAIEAAGASVVGEAHVFAAARLGPELHVGQSEPERSIAAHIREASIAPRAFLDRAAWTTARAVAVRATAVLIWLTREDEALAWAAPAQRRSLTAAGLPVLALTAARWQADDGASSRIAEFIGGLVDASA